MRIKNLILLGFVVFSISGGHTMHYAIDQQSAELSWTLSEKIDSVGLNTYFNSISSLKERPFETNEQVVAILEDALQKLDDAFRKIEDNWGPGEDISNSPEVQKMSCKRELYDLYQSLHERFKDIDSEDATRIRTRLQELGIVE